MFRRKRCAVLAALCVVLTACAAGPGGIDNWPVTNAEKNGFVGTVVDLQCELTGNCADNCGEGKRQLAIKTEEFGTVFAVKNLNNYSGAVEEVWPFCAETVEVNGLFTEHKGVKFFQVQNVREPGGNWLKATRYLEVWSKQTGKPLSVAGRWYNHDNRVQEILDRDGLLGLGVEADKEYFQ